VDWKNCYYTIYIFILKIGFPANGGGSVMGAAGYKAREQRVSQINWNLGFGNLKFFPAFFISKIA